jgi:NADPH:quinone reductase-like Zn-dependent oxidoreductase
MKAIVYFRYGPPEVLRLADVEKPTPKDDEVLIKIHATTVTAGDCEIRAFKFPALFWIPIRIMFGLLKPKRNILGQELAGEVEAVGKVVSNFKEGDQVFAATGGRLGAHAEYISLPNDVAMAKKSPSISYEEAAAIPTGGINALHYLKMGDIESGDKILINGAAGNFGTFAVQLAKHFGAEVTAVDSTDKLELLRSIGADHVVDFTKEDFTKNGESYDIIFDVVGKSPFGRSVKALKPTGRYVIAIPKFFPLIRGSWISKTSNKKILFKFADYKSEELVFLGELIEAGKIKVVIDKTYSFEEIPDAHRYVETGRKQGNVVVAL